jgi:hypothetical protein
MSIARSLTLAALAVAACASACGPAQATSVANGQEPPPPGARVEVIPSQTSVAVGGDRQFQATVVQAANTAVTWTVQGGGSISGNGLYTAPGAAGVYHVVATSVAAPAVSGSATVNVTSGGGGGGAAYVFPADRVTQWKPGVTYNGGIPSRTTSCATLSAATYGNGSSDASSAIQAALNACPAGQVVTLGPGTFLVNTFLRIGKAITLRGAGAGVTILQKTNGAVPNVDSTGANAAPLVILGPDRWPKPDGTTSQNLTADGAKGAMSVTVASGAGFAAGQFVLLDELSGATWMTDPLGRGQIWGALDGRVTWMFHNPAWSGVDDPLVATTPTSGNAASWFSRQDRVTNEVKEVASVSGNTVSFTTPVHISYRTSHTAQLTRYTGVSVHVRNAGLEGVTLKGGSDGALRFEAAAYSWAKNVEITIWRGEGVAFNNAFRCELRDSYIHDAAFAVPGGGAYSISFASGTAENLVENNISMMANKVMVARSSGAGSVVGYNYMDDGYINYAENWIETGLNASHMVGSHHVLFEGNYGFNWDSEHTHGSAVYMTVFRNWLRGIRKPFVNPQTGHTIDDANTTQSAPKRCVGVQAYSYWMTFAGNVLGAAGQMSGWTYEPTGPDAMGKPSIWLLGWDNLNGNGQNYPYEAALAPTVIRDGNWDWLQSKQSWHNNVVSATLPDSLYMPGKPAFFGSNPWPWVDPVTGTTYTLPAKARFDAGTPNTVP